LPPFVGVEPRMARIEHGLHGSLPLFPGVGKGIREIKAFICVIRGSGDLSVFILTPVLYGHSMLFGKDTWVTLVRTHR